MVNYETFKTKKRDWFELVRALEYNGKLKICHELYTKIMKDLKKENTDGVILADGKGLKRLGTISGVESKGGISEPIFVPFSYEQLTKEEKQMDDHVRKENERMSHTTGGIEWQK